jgi:hypothetical protein
VLVGITAWSDLKLVINALSGLGNAISQALFFEYRFRENGGALSSTVSVKSTIT